VLLMEKRAVEAVVFPGGAPTMSEEWGGLRTPQSARELEPVS
jgi:hypothetical protein